MLHRGCSCCDSPLRLGLTRYRYLYTEWEDPGFGPRAATVHTQFTQMAAEPLKEAISNQMQLIAQLKHINTEIKVCSWPSSCLPVSITSDTL